MVDALNTILRKIGLSSNMSGVIKSVTIPLDSEVEVPHNLKVVPKYWIIVDQRGQAIIERGDKAFTDRAIYLKSKNIGGSGEDAEISVLIMRE